MSTAQTNCAKWRRENVPVWVRDKGCKAPVLIRDWAMLNEGLAIIDMRLPHAELIEQLRIDAEENGPHPRGSTLPTSVTTPSSHRRRRVSGSAVSVVR